MDAVQSSASHESQLVREHKELLKAVKLHVKQG